jgi:arsenite-transporting ATPase
VITRFIAWFKEFGIPVGGVVVNMVIDKLQVKAESPEFVRNRVSMQDNYMKQIETDFAGMVRAVLPLFETEIRGVEMLKRTANALYGA